LLATLLQCKKTLERAIRFSERDAPSRTHEGNMSSTTKGNRPLSPHLSIYKPIPTMVTSIVHRITGIALYFGTVIVAWWLIAAATSESYFDFVQIFLGTWFGRLILFGFTWALMQHMLGGIRHLIWDTGRMFDKNLSTKLSILSIFVSVGLTILIWVVGYSVR
jgi:succinate dehydrogenase / fumarate reductase, cytochrome b subunit